MQEQQNDPHLSKTTLETQVPASATTQQWLTLKEASDFLGVHFTTLRTWTDKGEIPVFRTPGGHRRFSLADLRRFLDERAGNVIVVNVNQMVDTALGRVRQELAKRPDTQMSWRSPLDEQLARVRRERGQRLFALALSYVLKPDQRDALEQEGRRLGLEYGCEAAANQVSLVEIGRAVQFFRNQLVEIVRTDEQLDASDIRIERLLHQFLDEVLYAVLDGYEATVKG
ncbi:MAG: helix-turn-helix domain-containing protein [Caldilineaceae bacterium]|nr:helix-turn-helix domain-containing protein [Caldilineaceae bacterium]